ncbi:MAG: TonB-dependent receptor [Ignavibacteriaceae bacterium]|nr:TonB-dependent receptor [Ignavibacteriaceae bacterium]
MNFKVVLLVLFSILINLSAQNFSVNGNITDFKNGSAIPGAIVFISYSRYSVTNSEGYYSIKNIPKGNYQVKVSRLGYKSLSEEVTVTTESITKNFILEISLIELDEVIVNSKRTEKYLRNSSYSELLIGKEQIESKPFQSLSDILKDQPGISLLRDGIWGTEISIRGLNRENIVTLIDGNRIATSTDIAARLSMINLNDIERIEVIKGAASSIYGSGATGGIINIITKAPQLYKNFTMKGDFSSGFNSVNNLSSWSGSFNSGSSFWSSKLAASYRKAANTKTPSGDLKNSQFKDYSFTGTVNIIPLENNSLKINYQVFKAENVGIPGASVFPDNAEVSYPYEKREMISTVYEIQNISKLFYKLSVKYSYQAIERNVENIPHTVQNVAATFTTPAKRVSVLRITPEAVHTNNNMQIQGNFLLGETSNFILGLDYWDRGYNGNREKFQKIELLDTLGNVKSTTDKIVGEKPLPNSKYKSLGVFAQDETELVKDKLSLSLGARLDKIWVIGETTLNPIYEVVNGVINYSPSGQKIIWNKIDATDVSYSENIGVKYSLNNCLDLTLSLGYSFRSPSLEERFQYIDQGSYVRIGDPNLKPEKGKSADLGIRYYLPYLKIVSSVFYNNFNNLVTEIPGTFEGRNAYIKTNIGKAQLYGFDFRSEYNFYDNFLSYLSASYVKGDDISANSNLPEIPPLNGTLGIKFSMFTLVELDISSTIFTAQQDVTTGEMTTPGYACFNFYCSTIHAKIGAIGFQLSGGMENVFNKEYRNHLSTSRGVIKSEPGRNIFIQLNLNW